MVHHRLVYETEPRAFTKTQDDWFGLAEFAPVDRPEVSLHISRQADLDDTVIVLVRIWLEGPQVTVRQDSCPWGRAGVVGDGIGHGLLHRGPHVRHVLASMKHVSLRSLLHAGCRRRIDLARLA